ncbi:cocaine esterase-like isoform X1 [Onthophagus taurus]|uniref:cocaine esterase-like isoform X1 n=1 Tax=Onthophagus taurus TaxID=166361 RepID=UPI0039BE57B7
MRISDNMRVNFRLVHNFRSVPDIVDMITTKTILIYVVLCGFIGYSEQKVRVKTQYGSVKGKNVYTVGKGKAYVAFQGIPYAKPPLGELRFAAPVSFDRWDHVYDATKPKSTCVELYENKGNEDCLYLNIFTPNINRSLPIMIWFHGGAFVFIYGSHTLNGVDYFIEEDVIVVTVHYRLGVFGFLSTEDETIPGNFGLKDQLMAVEWIHKNIHHFGGNPNKITLVGQSAGAVSAQYLTMHKRLEGKISGIIQQSGSVLVPWALSRYPRTGAYVLGGKLGVSTTDSTILLKELRKKSTEELRNASFSTHMEVVFGGGTFNSLLFIPVREPPHKGSYFSSMAFEDLKRGEFKRIPKMIGINSLEAAFMIGEFQAFNKYYQNYDQNIRRYLPNDLNSRNELAAKLIKDHYIGNHSFTSNISNTVHFASDDQFVRPILKDVYLASPFAKTYLYHFTYQGNLGKRNRTLNGVEHGEELEYLFYGKHQGNIDNDDKKMREKLVKLWCNFIKTGNPTPSKDDLFNNQIWEPVNADTDHTTCFEIDKKINIIENPHREDVEFWEKIYSEYGNRPFDTY